ncbi:MAG: FAD-binding protein [Anaerolineae bacterium]|nr:FAD-binding protein [Anaerolineae bacterium]
MISKAEDGFYHPTTEAEICELVKHAAEQGLKVRVRGSGHSVQSAIYTGDFKSPPRDDPNINIYLDNMISVCFDYEHKQVTAEAGCHLGKDPTDPTSTIKNSLLYQIDCKGWALSDTGGIIHQTVGGFMLSGSSGGSLSDSVAWQIVAIRAVDGLGNIHDFRKTDDLNNPFYGMGVSMGLLGIITSVTFQCVDRYDIIGVETTSSLKECAIDLFGPGGNDKPSLDGYFRDIQYSRLLWYPQEGVGKVVVWEAHKLDKTPENFKPKHYHLFPSILGSELPAQIFASTMFKLFDILNPPEPTSKLGKLGRQILKPFYSLIVNYFLASAVLAPQQFQDVWWQGLPMDNNVNYKLMPTQFTELWLPLSTAADVMQELRLAYEEGGFNATGTHTCEIYMSASNNFWMSPSYQQDVIRVDPFWFGKNRGNPNEVYYPMYWERLKKFNYRLHWGKALSGDVGYLKAQYPRWDDFMSLREHMDPHQVFVTDYWRRNLGIDAD